MPFQPPPALTLEAAGPTYPPVFLLQTVQALRLALLPNIWLVEDEVLPTALLCQQTGVFVASNLWGTADGHRHSLPPQIFPN